MKQTDYNTQQEQNDPSAFVEELRQQPHGQELEALHHKSLEAGRELRSLRETPATEQEAEQYFRHLQQVRNQRERKSSRWMPLWALTTAAVTAFVAFFGVQNGWFEGKQNPSTIADSVAKKKMERRQKIAGFVLDAFNTSLADDSQTNNGQASATNNGNEPSLWAAADTQDNADDADPAPISQTLPEPLNFLNEDE